MWAKPRGDASDRCNNPIVITDDEDDAFHSNQFIARKSKSHTAGGVIDLLSDDDEIPQITPDISDDESASAAAEVVSSPFFPTGKSVQDAFSACQGVKHVAPDASSYSEAKPPSEDQQPKKKKLEPRRFFGWNTPDPDDATKKRPSGLLESKSKRNAFDFGQSEQVMRQNSVQKPPISVKNQPKSNYYHDPEDSSGDEDISAPPEDIPVPQVIMHHPVVIGGVDVDFPLKPYSPQIAVMNGLIRALNKGEPALLESPTGTGKTLALLCGALAWRKAYSEKYRQQYNEWKQAHINIDPDSKENVGNNVLSEEAKLEAMEPPEKIPKIFYGSRTHRQIKQVIKELKRTAYADAKMTVLSGRDFTCIQHTQKNKNDLCNDLLDPRKSNDGCPFNNELQKRTGGVPSLISKMIQLPRPWDIEDIVEQGIDQGYCPYYAARALMADAEIIFCPYNYIIEPAIRKAMQISLKGAIVILDEAHNIEDICRNAASVSLTMDQLTDIVKDCDSFDSHFLREKPPPFAQMIKDFCSNFTDFIKNTNLTNTADSGDQLTSKRWTMTELLEMMRLNRITEKNLQDFKQAWTEATEHAIRAKDPPAPGQHPPPVLSNTTMRIVDDIMFFIEVVMTELVEKDYKAFVKEIPRKFIKAASEGSGGGGGATQKRVNERIKVLDVLCMNPALAFRQIQDVARSVILASGTLSPMASFASELATKFPTPLHANHVIARNQVYIRAVSHGPKGDPLQATWRFINTWEFQENLGTVLRDVCATVPGGILCFMSSYTTLNKMTARWRQTGLMTEIERTKFVMEEPRISAHLTGVMADFRQKIRECSQNSSGITGVVMFAVFRGKIAEGIDFSDDEARCVITVGIPYAFKTDPAVSLKLTYNDSAPKDKGLLKGQEWYTVQAFRALNQALGRCIRHKNDWGAILLVDNRFLEPYNQKYLPSWVKSFWSNKSTDYNLPAELSRFVAERTGNAQ